MNVSRLIIINDCSDANARLRIESQATLAFPGVPMSFYAAEPFATLSLSFLLSEGDFRTGDVVLFNAAPRNAVESHKDNRGGAMIFVTLKNGAVLVGPNDGQVLALIKDQIEAIYMKKGDDGNQSGTQFRSAYVFPKAAGEFAAVDPADRDKNYELQDLSGWIWNEPEQSQIVWIDSFDNLKLSSTTTLETDRDYTVRFVREGKLVGDIKLPYRGRLTKLAPGELGLITGSSFGQKGLEIARRTGQVGLAGASRFIEEQFGFRPRLEDEVHIA